MAEYLSIMKAKNNWYCRQKENERNVIISTSTLFHPCLDVLVIKYVADIPLSICNKKQSHQYIQLQNIYIDDADNYYILDEITSHDNIEYKI